MKKNNKLMIITTIICLIPVLFSLTLYKKLPDTVAIHFNSSGEPDGYAPKFIAAFGLPIIMTVIIAFGLILIFNDPQKDNSSEVLKLIGIWTAPVLSVILTPLTLFISLGADIPIHIIIPAMVGILFIICGNYLPKCKQNYTVGIKLPWTLNDTDNWNKTHHLAGYLWIAGGFIVTISTLLDSTLAFAIMIISLISMVLIPTFYSYSLSKKVNR